MKTYIGSLSRKGIFVSTVMLVLLAMLISNEDLKFGSSKQGKTRLAPIGWKLVVAIHLVVAIASITKVLISKNNQIMYLPCFSMNVLITRPVKSRQILSNITRKFNINGIIMINFQKVFHYNNQFKIFFFFINFLDKKRF